MLKYFEPTFVNPFGQLYNYHFGVVIFYKVVLVEVITKWVVLSLGITTLLDPKTE